MPKIKPTEQEEANRIVRACISGNMERYMVSEDLMAAKLGVTKRTIQNRRNQPGSFELKDIQRLAKILKFTPIQAASMVLGRDLTNKEIKEFILM